MPALAVAVALKSGCPVADGVFDGVFPAQLRFASYQHWTPVLQAMRAARLLVDAGATRILDVGSGPGKFCIVGALITQASFTGIDRREQLVQIARAVGHRIGAERARFVCANVLRFPFDGFDGFYLFNPFYEQLNPSLLPIDETTTHSPLRFHRCVEATRQKLSARPIGTAVVTYHGFGGTMPHSYRLVDEESAGGDALALWIKVRP